MKRIILAFAIIISAISLISCGPKINSEHIFKSGIYESKTNNELTHYYTFYKDENGGTVDEKTGTTGLPFRFDVLDVKGNKANVVFHMGDESDNTKATITMKNENEYTINYDDGRVHQLTFVNEDLKQLESYFNLHE